MNCVSLRDVYVSSEAPCLLAQVVSSFTDVDDRVEEENCNVMNAQSLQWIV